MTHTFQHLRVNDYDRATVIEFADRKILEELSIVEIGDELSQLAESQPSRALILSFGNVDHLSSAALGMLIKLREQIARQNGKLILTDIKPRIFEVFKITKLNRLFEIYSTTHEAFERLSKQQ